MLDKMLTVLEFDSEDERNDYIRVKKKEKIKMALRQGDVISVKPLRTPSRKKTSITQASGGKQALALRQAKQTIFESGKSALSRFDSLRRINGARGFDWAVSESAVRKAPNLKLQAPEKHQIPSSKLQIASGRLFGA